MPYFVRELPSQLPPSFTPKSMHGLVVTTTYPWQQLLHCYLYIWLRDATEFWFYVLDKSTTSLHGYVWFEQQWQYREIPMDMLYAYF